MFVFGVAAHLLKPDKTDTVAKASDPPPVQPEQQDASVSHPQTRLPHQARHPPIIIPSPDQHNPNATQLSQSNSTNQFPTNSHPNSQQQTSQQKTPPAPKQSQHRLQSTQNGNKSVASAKTNSAQKAHGKSRTQKPKNQGDFDRRYCTSYHFFTPLACVQLMCMYVEDILADVELTGIRIVLGVGVVVGVAPEVEGGMLDMLQKLGKLHAMLNHAFEYFVLRLLECFQRQCEFEQIWTKFVV